MTELSGHSKAIDPKVLKILEQYFNIEIDPAEPVLQELETVHIDGGEWLMRQGDPGNALYFLVRGRLQAWARGANGEDRGRFLNEIVAGDSVGELSLLTGAPRAVGIQAIRDSLLIRIDRDMFDRLALQHPALVMRLAVNVANLLQNANAPSKSSTRNLQAITVLSLDDTSQTEEFCRQFTRDLDRQGSTLSLFAASLGHAGAPVDVLESDEPVPENLRHWLEDQENQYRYLVYNCRAGNSTWSQFALRHSDMVLLVGDAACSPRQRKWEQDLLRSSGDTVARRMLILLQPSSADSIRNTAEWLNQRHADFHIHVREGRPDDISRVTRIVSGNALGLVLAGGAARGFAHLGVYRAMRELGLSVDWIGGTSIGAIMGAALASPISIEQAMDLARLSFVKGKPFSDFTIPMMSLVRGKRMENLLEEHLPYDIEDLPIPFFCVSCSLDTGSMNLHERGSTPDALRASAALPGIIPPAVVNSRLTIDGSVVNNLPVDIMRQKPVSRIVAVDLASQDAVHVDYDNLPSPWAVLRGRYLPFSKKHRVPALSSIILKSTILGTQERVRQQGLKADILLKPPVQKFGMMEVKSFEKIVDTGYRHALDELKQWLEKQDAQTP
jgi:predicted acylesterase/phospholipase RssA/CRP-like cAMP-binding protein